MPADRIEREIDIDAPIDVVCTVITEPEHITGWFTDSAELDVCPGGEGRIGWDARATRRETVVKLRVERLDPPHFSFRWHYPDGAEPTEANAPLVEFSLEARGGSTRLRLAESGLDEIARSEAAEHHRRLMPRGDSCASSRSPRQPVPTIRSMSRSVRSARQRVRTGSPCSPHDAAEA